MWRAARIIRFVLLFALILLLLSPRKFFFVDMELLFLTSTVGALTAGILGWVLYRNLKTGRVQNKNDDISKSESPNWYWFMIIVNTLCLGVLVVITLLPIHMLWTVGML